MNLDINKQSLLDLNKKARSFYSKNKIFIISFLLVVLFGVILYRINYFSSLEPTQTMIQDQLQSSKRIKIDKNIADKLRALESQNVKVQALFEEARDNPFKE